MSLICQKCQSSLKPNDVVCPGCGQRLGGETAIGNLEQHAISSAKLSSRLTHSRLNDLHDTADSRAILDVDLHLESALDSIEQADFSSALLSLNRAIVDADPDRLAECFSLRGYVHLKLGQFLRAEMDCSEAISRLRFDGQTFAWRAAARGEQDKWPAAFDDLAQALQLSMDDGEEYLRLMESYIETASEYYRDRIITDGENSQLFFDRGWVYFRASKLDKAERDFQLALKFDAHHGRAALGMAEILLHDGKYEETLQHCETAIKADPGCEREVLLIRIQANHKLGRLKDASKDLRRLKTLSESNAAQLLEIAKLRYGLGEYVRAISDLTGVLKLDHQTHRALLMRADCYRAIQNYSPAINDYSKYLRFQPDSVSARIGRGQAYLKSKQQERAIADFDRALQLNNISPDAFLGRSQAFLELGRLDQALTECQKASRLDNSRPDVFAMLAEIQYRMCDYSRSIEEFSRAAQLSTDTVQQATYFYRRGNAFYELGDMDSALNDFRRTTQLKPDHAGAWIWTAAVAAKMENWSDAIIGLERAIHCKPLAAEQYLKMGQPVAEKAAGYYTRQQQRGKENAELFRRRGLAYQFLGKTREAIEDFDRALEMHPGDPDTLIRRGRALARNGEHPKAIKDFTNAMLRDKENHVARYWRASSWLACGETKKAASDISKAIRLDPSQSRYHLLHSDLMQAAQNWPKAVKSLERAISSDASDPLPYRRRAAIFSQMGQHLRAISDLTRAHELNPMQLEILVARGNAHAKAQQHDLAQLDFELALTHNNALPGAYAGRGLSLAAQGQHDSGLIWLTKAIHRFRDQRDLSTILFARGKVYYQMGLYDLAINDFTYTMEIVRESRPMVAAIRTARAAAYVQNERWSLAAGDLDWVLRFQPGNESIKKALAWTTSDTRNGARPLLFVAPEHLIRPLRPPIVRQPFPNGDDILEHETQPPYDSWIIKTAEKKEYGPASIRTLAVWIGEGRVDLGMQLLRCDWSSWKRVEKIVPSLVPKPEVIENFPKLDIRSTHHSDRDGDPDSIKT